MTSSVFRLLLRAQKRAQRGATIESVRRMSRWTERLYSVPKDVRWDKVERGDLNYEWLTPKNVSSSQVIFHIHGGGFVFPLYNPIRFTTAYLVRLAGTRAVLVDYHLAPEHPFPTAVEDCVRAYRWLLDEEKVSPEKVVFTGESAGGNLVLTTLLALRDAGDPLPAAGVSICPALDFEGGGTFYTQDDPMADADFVMRQLTAYRGNADPHTPLLSPLYADLRGLPPLLVQVGEAEVLRSGAEAFAARAEQCDVRVTLQIWPGMWHFWHLFVPWLPEARQAMIEIRDFIRAPEKSHAKWK
ncbi:MAG: alpha/beta hydrolase [Chloroflexi bacterium]|nr:alpha/beta hydrolase [Chloroflexota bacterium]